MQLQRLTGLERQKILDELAELLEDRSNDCAPILASERLLMQIIVGRAARRVESATATTGAPRSSTRPAS